jgi:hypothetical protein
VTAYRVIFRLSPHRVLHGIQCAVAALRVPTEPIFTRVDCALGLIRRHDPLRFSRLGQDVERILVSGQETTRIAYFYGPLRWCVLTVRDAADDRVPPEELVASIVHEATHARLVRRGIAYPEPLRRRIEVLCAKQQLAFVSRLPQAADLAARYAKRVSKWSAGAQGEWSDQKLRRDALQEAGENQVPRWLLRLLEWLAKRRAA